MKPSAESSAFSREIDIRERLAVGVADFKATGYHALPLPNVTQGLSGARNGLSSFPNLELNEDMLDVRFDGLGCDGKNSCDFLVRSTLGDQIEDVSLANTEWLCNRGNCRGQRRFKIYKATFVPPLLVIAGDFKNVSAAVVILRLRSLLQ